MSQRLPNSSHQGGFSLSLQPVPAWTAILGLVLFSALCILAGGSSILRLAFPVCSVVVGIFLYLRYPVLYIGFSWWVSLITPWLRRIVDYQSGWDDKPIILLSPYLVMLITIATFLRELPKSHRQGSLPFVLACTGVFYGFLVGLIKNPPLAVARALLDWLTPVLFAFHLFVNWRDYYNYRQNIQRTFLWGVLITGAYGVLQYLVAPEWDRFWLIKTELTSMGSPEPLGIRVFSTLHSVGSFSSFMVSGLLLLFAGQGALRFPAAVVGYLSFLLSLSRTGWGSLFLGLILFISSLKPRLQMRITITVLTVAMCVLPLTTIEPFSNIINSRFQTFSNLQGDQSYQDRSGNYDENLSLALSTGLGGGIGNTFIINSNGALQVVVIDSGIIDLFFTLGWFGAIPYLAGLILIFFNLLQYSEGSFDPFASAARAIGLASCAQLVIGSAMIGFGGVILWGFLGMSMAAHKYHQHQITTVKGRLTI